MTRRLLAASALAALAALAPPSVRAEEDSAEWFRKLDQADKRSRAEALRERIERRKDLERRRSVEELEGMESSARGDAIARYESILLGAEAVDEKDLENVVHRLAQLYAESEAARLKRTEAAYAEEVRQQKIGLRKDAPPEPKANFGQSKRYYRMLLDRFPQTKHAEEAMYFLAYAEEEEGGGEAAVPLYEALLARFPGGRYTAEARMRIGEQHFLNEDWARAERAYDAAIAAGPSPFLEKALFKKGWCRYITGRQAEARETFLALLDQFAADPEKQKGELYKETVEVLAKSSSEAEPGAELRSITERSKGKAYGVTVYQALADLYREQSRYKDAAETYKYLLDSYPTYAAAPEAEAAYIDSLSLEKKLEEANALRENMAAKYGPGTAWWKANEDEERRAKAQEISRHMLSVVTQYHHGKAQQGGSAQDYANAIRLYKKFLAAFPDSPERLEARYNYAKALAETKDYSEAIAQFGAVARHPDFADKPNPYREKAAYQRILVVSDMEKGREVPADQVLAVYEDYIALNPRGERVPQLLYKQGEILFNRKDFARSAAAFDRVAEEHPEDPRVKDARIMAAQALFEAGRYEDVERRGRYNLMHLPLSDQERAKQRDLLSIASFKRAEALEAEGAGAAAADRFADLYAEFQDRAVAPHALYNAALGYKKAGKVSEALAAYEKLLRAHPDSEYAFDAALLAIAQHEEDRNWGAVEDKLEIARKLRPQAPETREIAWRLAEGVNAAGDAKNAARLYDAYARLHPDDKERIGAGRLRVFAAEFEKLPADAPESRLREMLARFDAIQREAGGKEKVDDYYRAALSFRAAELHFADYQKVRFDKNAEANLKRKTAMLESLTKEYLDVANLGFKEFRAAASYKLGYVYEDFHEALVEAPVPAELSAPDEIEMYKKLVAEKAAPYKKEAVAAYEALIKRAGESDAYDRWTTRALLKLSILSPLTHQPLEMEIVMPGPELRFLETEVEPDVARAAPEGGPLAGEDLEALRSKFGFGVAEFDANPGAPGKAREKFLEALEIGGGGGGRYPAVLFNIGLAFHLDGSGKLAEQYYEKAAALAPDWAKPLANLGALQIEDGRCEDAARSLERAASAASGYSLAYANWGRALECRKDDAGAMRIYDLAFALPGPSIHLLAARGALALKTGDTAKAEESFRPLIEAETPSPEALAFAGRALLEKGTAPARALADEVYARAVEAGGGGAVALNNNLGVLARREGKPELARERFHAALELDAGAAAVHNNLGVLAVLEGNPKLALTNYEKALSIDPDLKEALLNVGILHELYFDDPARAQAFYDRYEQAGGARLDRIKGLAEIRGERGSEG